MDWYYRPAYLRYHRYNTNAGVEEPDFYHPAYAQWWRTEWFAWPWLEWKGLKSFSVPAAAGNWFILPKPGEDGMSKFREQIRTPVYMWILEF